NEIAAICLRIWDPKKPVVQAHLNGYRVLGGHPVDRPADASTIRGITALCRRIVRAPELDHFAGLILDDLLAPNEIGVAQPNLTTRCKSVIPGRRILPEIVPVDIDFSPKRHFTGAFSRHVVGPVGRIQHLARPLRVIRDDHLERPKDAHHPGCLEIEVITNGVLERRRLNTALRSRHSLILPESAYGLRRHATPPKAGERRKARV